MSFYKDKDNRRKGIVGQLLPGLKGSCWVCCWGVENITTNPIAVPINVKIPPPIAILRRNTTDSIVMIIRITINNNNNDNYNNNNNNNNNNKKQ